MKNGKNQLEFVVSMSTSILVSFMNQDYKARKIKTIKNLKNKNPYLYKAKNLNTPELIVRGCLDAHISSKRRNNFW
jgi:hypothetical protein